MKAKKFIKAMIEGRIKVVVVSTSPEFNKAKLTDAIYKAELPLKLRSKWAKLCADNHYHSLAVDIKNHGECRCQTSADAYWNALIYALLPKSVKSDYKN